MTSSGDCLPTEAHLLKQDEGREFRLLDPNPKLTMVLNDSQLEVVSVSNEKLFDDSSQTNLQYDESNDMQKNIYAPYKQIDKKTRLTRSANIANNAN